MSAKTNGSLGSRGSVRKLIGESPVADLCDSGEGKMKQPQGWAASRFGSSAGAGNCLVSGVLPSLAAATFPLQKHKSFYSPALEAAPPETGALRQRKANAAGTLGAAWRY